MFLKLFEIGSFYKWHSAKEIALIIEELETSKKSLLYFNPEQLSRIGTHISSVQPGKTVDSKMTASFLFRIIIKAM